MKLLETDPLLVCDGIEGKIGDCGSIEGNGRRFAEKLSG